MIMKIVDYLVKSELPYIVVILIGIIVYEAWSRKKENDRYFQVLTSFKQEAVDLMKAMAEAANAQIERQNLILEEIKKSHITIRDAVMRLEGMIMRNGLRNGRQ